MVVAVEGPSAAGKTTWCRARTGRSVAEHAPTGREPDGSDLDAQADYWVGVNSSRWSAALDLEASNGTAVCDGDPLKLHYSWCLAVVGAAPWSRFEREHQGSRDAFDRGELGLADVVVVSLASQEVVRARRGDDPTRRRRSFDLHVRLREPLLAWYRAVDALDPGRVAWELPHHDAALGSQGPRPHRCDAGLLDAIVESLPVS